MSNLYLLAGREDESLNICIKKLSSLLKKPKNEIINMILDKLNLNLKSNFSLEEVNNKNYTIVSVGPESFLVSSPYKKEAMKLAKIYIKKQGWQIDFDYDDILLYPRNYVKKARVLFAAGKYI